MFGTFWIIFLLLLWTAFVISSVIHQIDQTSYLIAFPILYAIWIVTIIVPLLRRSNFCQTFIVMINLFMFAWTIFYMYGWNPVFTQDCGGTLCSNAPENGQYFNPLSTLTSVGDPKQHRMICPSLDCKWASDNGKGPIGYHLDFNGFIDYNQPNGAYASPRPEDYQNNKARGFVNGYIEGFTLINEQVPCPGVSSVLGEGEVICAHCSFYLLGLCQTNGLEYICELCPKLNYDVYFWLVWFGIWTLVSLFTFAVKDKSYPTFGTKETTQKIL